MTHGRKWTIATHHDCFNRIGFETTPRPAVRARQASHVCILAQAQTSVKKRSPRHLEAHEGNGRRQENPSIQTRHRARAWLTVTHTNRSSRPKPPSFITAPRPPVPVSLVAVASRRRSSKECPWPGVASARRLAPRLFSKTAPRPPIHALSLPPARPRPASGDLPLQLLPLCGGDPVDHRLILLHLAEDFHLGGERTRPACHAVRPARRLFLEVVKPSKVPCDAYGLPIRCAGCATMHARRVRSTGGPWRCLPATRCIPGGLFNLCFSELQHLPRSTAFNSARIFPSSDVD